MIQKYAYEVCPIMLKMLDYLISENAQLREFASHPAIYNFSSLSFSYKRKDRLGNYFNFPHMKWFKIREKH